VIFSAVEVCYVLQLRMVKPVIWRTWQFPQVLALTLSLIQTVSMFCISSLLTAVYSRCCDRYCQIANCDKGFLLTMIHGAPWWI